MTTLTNEQMRHHEEQGYVLVSVLIPEPVAQEAAAMWRRPDGDPVEVITIPDRAYTINVFPRPGAVWEWPHPHSDHAIRADGYPVFPRAFRVAGMTFLNDVPPHGAGTVLWPGCHRKLADPARSDPERYEMMWALNQDQNRVDLGEPVELTPRYGDALLYRYLCAHAGSSDTSSQPRLALNIKW